MRSILPAIALLLLPSGSVAQQETAAAWAGDARALLAAMDSLHPAPYRVHARADWERLVEEVEGRFASVTLEQAVGQLARVVAMAEDGHTQVARVPIATFGARYPLQFGVFSDGLYVTHTTERHRALLGRKVTAIGGVSIADVVAKMRPYLPVDNEAWLLRLLPAQFRNPGNLYAMGVLPEVDAPLTLTLMGKDGTRTSATLESGVAGDWIAADTLEHPITMLPMYRERRGNYWFRYLPDHRTVYVRYRAVANDSSESIAAFAERLFAFVDSADVGRMVIDLRRNGGGNNYLNQPLVHGLIRATKVNQPGKLFVIIDRGTFSAAISFVGEVERHTHALFVGEPTGSPVNQYGDAVTVRLPASGMSVRISTLYWQFSDPRDTREWVAPDIPVKVTFADWAARKDPVLEAIYAWDRRVPLRPPVQNWRRVSQKRPLGPLVVWD